MLSSAVREAIRKSFVIIVNDMDGDGLIVTDDENFAGYADSLIDDIEAAINAEQMADLERFGG